MQDYLRAGYDAAFIRRAPVVEAFAEYKNVQELIEGEQLNATTDILIAVGLFCAHMQTDPEAFPIRGNPGRTFHEVSEDADPTFSAQERESLGGIAAGAVDSTIDFLRKVRHYALELLMCNQVKPLKLANIKNYFKSAGVTVQSVEYILKFLRVDSPRAGNLVADDALRSVAVRNQFVKYHIAYASGGQLIVKVIDSLGGIAPYFFSNAERNAARASSVAIWDIDLNQAIPKRAFVVAYAYLEVVDMLPDNWYQGTREYEAASIGVRRDLKKVFKILERVSKRTPGLDAASTVEDVLRNLPASVLADGAPAPPEEAAADAAHEEE